jgi:hypothetical protein
MKIYSYRPVTEKLSDIGLSIFGIDIQLASQNVMFNLLQTLTREGNLIS